MEGFFAPFFEVGFFWSLLDTLYWTTEATELARCNNYIYLPTFIVLSSASIVRFIPNSWNALQV